ncbi:MAG TPA: hypothetical protein VGG51_00430 [Candidatus Cybelea sp.]
MALLAGGCNGGVPSHSYVPAASTFGNPLVRWAGVSLPPCRAHYYHAPGKFTIFSALGTFVGNSFAESAVSIWANFSFRKGRKHLPVIQLPSIKAPYTVYYGTYKLGNGMAGCFYLPKVHYQGVSFDGAAAAVPNLHEYGKATPLAEGPLLISVKGIGAKTGSGTVTLKSASGGRVVNTGTVHIEGSKDVK